MKNKFLNFLSGLQTSDNKNLIESIAYGYLVCFEAIKIPDFRVRELLEEEAKKINSKIPNVPIAMLMRSWVVAEKETNQPVKMFSNRYDAENYRNHLEEQIREKFKPSMFLPPYPYPQPLQQEEGEENIPPEIRAMNSQEKAKFFNWLSLYQNYEKDVKDLGEYLVEYNKRFPKEEIKEVV
jgi:hypothetical protein